MKNIQVIDGAMNAKYDVFEATDEEFALIFPNDTDVEFIEDLIARLGEDVADRILGPIWFRRADKRTICGIHGTLFYELHYKKQYYPNKKDGD